MQKNRNRAAAIQGGSLHASIWVMLALGVVASPWGRAEAQETQNEQAVHSLDSVQVLGTAEEQMKQALGVSVITSQDIENTPPANDLADIIRRQPGVNLTGTSGSGIRGNNRQIDIRGMGPENTLILIDGVPVRSRNAVRYGWGGDRDSRGDTNWVPVEMVESVEVLRGPAAARYGSGAMGGVVSIRTKGVADKPTGSVTYYTNQPDDSKEGATNRVNLSLSTPITETLGIRAYANWNHTDPDSLNMAEGYNNRFRHAIANGREGVVNKDANVLLAWKPNSTHSFDLETSYSRQGNRYAGDSPFWHDDGIDGLYNSETNVMYRQAVSLTHRGRYDWGDSLLSAAYDVTRNHRQREGLSGSVEGAPGSGGDDLGVFDTARLRTVQLRGEVNVPFAVADVAQVLTVGAEDLRESLNDPGGMRDSLNAQQGSATRARQASQAIYVESNIEASENLTLTPGMRFDHSDTFGSNWSPSLNAEYWLTSAWSIKGGIARAYKVPNLYQATENYVLNSRGMGCWMSNGPCYLVGNPDLKPETSINKEIGVSYDPGDWRFSVAYFRNDYKNKVDAGTTSVGTIGGSQVYQWSNTGKALVQGLEGNLYFRLGESVEWNNNLTYMIDAERRSGRFKDEPLSIIPEFTLNSTLDWSVNQRLSLGATLTWYGVQKPPSLAQTGREMSNQERISPYAIAGISAGYVVNSNLRLRFGISNLFDKRIYRGGNAEDAGAYTYNERGRAYYARITASF
ncbi:FepA family TonB-dependent siderophore receptor [Corticimicrobacter populi]|nr:FepA family TonB-dependent siderophore receptor [Corticimicrobacter populi]